MPQSLTQVFDLFYNFSSILKKNKPILRPFEGFKNNKALCLGLKEKQKE